MSRRAATLPLCAAALVLVGACGRKIDAGDSPRAVAHQHHAPHDGTAIALGDEAFHLEFVLDATNGSLKAFVLDGEMENFVRIASPSFELIAMVNGERRMLSFNAVSDSATGETVGDTSSFAASADWLKSIREFDAVLTSIMIRGATFAGVAFHFPHGNDSDHHLH